MHRRQAGPRGTVGAVQIDRVLEHVAACFQIRLRQTRQILPPAQVVFVGSRARLRPHQRLLLSAAEDASPQGRRDALRNLVFDGKDVFERAIEALGPAMIAGGHFNELHGHAQAVVRLANAALE